MDSRVIQADFDRIAMLSNDGWGHSRQYYEFLLRQLPPRCACALEIGCGTGGFSRLLARRAGYVLAVDLSPRMVQVARKRSRHYPNVDFQVADATMWRFPVERYDCVACIATLHHLPIEEMLSKMRNALKIGGTLVVLDLFQGEGLFDALSSVLAVPVSAALRLVKTGRLRESRQVRVVWAEHGRHDSYPTLSRIRRVCASLLPGADVRRHLLWRYSIIWRKTVLSQREGGKLREVSELVHTAPIDGGG